MRRRLWQNSKRCHRMFTRHSKSLPEANEVHLQTQKERKKEKERKKRMKEGRKEEKEIKDNIK